MSETLNIIGEIQAIETIAEGHGIRELTQLRQRYGYGNWRKKKWDCNGGITRWRNNKSRNPLV